MAIKLRTFLFVLVLFAVLLFAAVNWPLFTETSPINLLVGTVMAPLGLVMLGVLVVVSMLYLLFLAKMETEILVGGRRTTRELEEARKLALSAEESRVSALRDELRQGIGSIDEKVAEILRRVDAQGRVAVRRETTILPETATPAGDEVA
jgi:uncharacterized integral membrane protein